MSSPTPSTKTLKTIALQDPQSCNSLAIELNQSLDLSPSSSVNSCQRNESPNQITSFDRRLAAKSTVRRELTASLDDLSKIKERMLKSVSCNPDKPMLDTITSSRSLSVNSVTRLRSDGVTGFGTSAGAKAGAETDIGTVVGTDAETDAGTYAGTDADKDKDKDTEFNFPYEKYRTNMLWDFYQVDDEETPVKAADLPLAKQQRALLSDLIYTLSGIRCGIITPLPRNKNADGIGKYETKFKVHEQIDKSLAHIVHEILPLASHFMGIQKLIAITEGHGQVNNALNEALQDLSHDFYLLLSQAEAELEKDRLTLPKMLYYMQPTIWVMKDIWTTLSSILLHNLKGATVLSHLCKSIKIMAGNKSTQDSLIDLAGKAAQPYMQMLQLWIQKGVIVDTYEEFMISDNESNQRGQLPEHYSDVYWEKRYTIRRDCIPTFLESYSDMILRTGKYLNVIRQCGKRAMPSQVMDLSYDPKNEQQHVKVLNDAYIFSARMLLNVLLTENDMMGHMQSVKRYLLLYQGDFLMEFMDACEDELAKNVDHVLPMTLENLLGLSLRLSSARNDKYKDNLHCELLTYDLVTQMSKIIKPTDVPWQSTDRLDLSGLECFAFTYEAKWPVSLVLNHTAISKYQMLFRQLFYCKHVERQLCKIWKENSMAKKFSPNAAELYRSAFTLRQRMMNAIQNLEYYMMIEIIEPNWHIFIVKMKTVENIDKVFSLHQDFLDVCLKNCMLTEPTHLNRAIFQLCKICLKFCEFIQRSQRLFLDAELKSMVRDSGEENTPQSDTEIVIPGQNQAEGLMNQSDTFTERVKSFDTDFKNMLISFLKQLTDLAQANTTGDRFMNLVHRINFNGYYSEQMEMLQIIK